jgi:hypothetical protein
MSQSRDSSRAATAGDILTAELIRAKLYHSVYSATMWTWFFQLLGMSRRQTGKLLPVLARLCFYTSQ